MFSGKECLEESGFISDLSNMADLLELGNASAHYYQLALAI